MTTSASLGPLVASLRPDVHRSLLVDLPGHGASRQMPRHSLHAMAEAVWQTIDHHGVEQPLLVGHSMGGQLVQLMAAMRPEGARGVIAINPVPAGGLPLPADAQELFRTAGGSADSFGAIMDMATHRLPPEARAQMVAWALTLQPSVVAETFDAWMTGGFADQLGAIRAPLSCIATDDPFLPPELLQAQVVDPIQGARMLTYRPSNGPGVGHYPHLEASEGFGALLQRLITGTR